MFGGLAEALMAYDRGDLDLQAEVTVRLKDAAPPAGFAAPEGWEPGEAVPADHHARPVPVQRVAA